MPRRDRADRLVGNLDRRVTRADRLWGAPVLIDLDRAFLNLDDREPRVDMPARVLAVRDRLLHAEMHVGGVGNHLL